MGSPWFSILSCCEDDLENVHAFENNRFRERRMAGESVAKLLSIRKKGRYMAPIYALYNGLFVAFRRTCP